MEKTSYVFRNIDNLRKNFFIRVLIYFLLVIQCTFASTNGYFQSSASLFSQWIQSKSQPTQNPFKNSEIWSRVRSRLNIRTPTTAPLYQRHIKEYARSQSYINKLVDNASPYLYYVLGEVERRGMPSEIALLPMIESDFNPFNRSHKGALGLWQIMPSLGRLYGLKQNAIYDGRRDIYESTKVALDHLEYLHKKFGGNWLLALAAYNSGEYRVLSAIKKNKAAKKPTDYWSLPLPKETKNYVPKLLALASIVKSPKQYGVKLPAIPNQPVFTRIDANKAVNIAHAAKMVNISESQLRKLNAGFKKTANPSGPFKFVVPIQNANVLKTTVQGKEVIVAKKEEVKSTSQAKNVKVVKKEEAKSTSQLKDVHVVKKEGSKSTAQNKKIHVVKKGDSIPKIARKHKIKISTLLAKNNLKHASSIIHPGQKLIIG